MLYGFTTAAQKMEALKNKVRKLEMCLAYVPPVDRPCEGPEDKVQIVPLYCMFKTWCHYDNITRLLIKALSVMLNFVAVCVRLILAHIWLLLGFVLEIWVWQDIPVPWPLGTHHLPPTPLEGEQGSHSGSLRYSRFTDYHIHSMWLVRSKLDQQYHTFRP